MNDDFKLNALFSTFDNIVKTASEKGMSGIYDDLKSNRLTSQPKTPYIVPSLAISGTQQSITLSSVLYNVLSVCQ